MNLQRLVWLQNLVQSQVSYYIYFVDRIDIDGRNDDSITMMMMVMMMVMMFDDD